MRQTLEVHISRQYFLHKKGDISDFICRTRLSNVEMEKTRDRSFEALNSGTSVEELIFKERKRYASDLSFPNSAIENSEET